MHLYFYFRCNKYRINMIASIIGGVLAAGSAIYGGIKSSKAAAEANEITRKQQLQNRTWYDMRMNEDYTKRADSQAAINKARELLLEHQRNVSASQAVAGTTDEAAALAKQSANNTIGDVTTNIAAQAANYKENVENQYMNRDAQLAQQEQSNLNQKAQNIANATGQASSAFATGAAAIEGSIADQKDAEAKAAVGNGVAFANGWAAGVGNKVMK